MNIQHLKYFHDSVQERGLAGAARKNHVTQSAVSQAVRRLEEALDCELLVHKKKHFALTESGRVVFSHCQGIFQSLESLKSEAKISKLEIAGSLSFATSHSIALAVLPEFLALFKSKYPKVTPRFRLGKTPLVKKWIEDREIDFAITVDDGALRGLETMTLHEGQFVNICRSKPSNAGKSFLLTEPRPETDRLRAAYRKKHAKELPVAFEVDSWEIIKRLTAEGLGIGFIPEFAFSDADRNLHRLRREAWQPPIAYTLCLARPKGMPVTRLQAVFFEELRAFLRKA